jgi:hypothetical protein
MLALDLSSRRKHGPGAQVGRPFKSNEKCLISHRLPRHRRYLRGPVSVSELRLALAVAVEEWRSDRYLQLTTRDPV